MDWNIWSIGYFLPPPPPPGTPAPPLPDLPWGGGRRGMEYWNAGK
jgi:hypothetical protein